MAQLVENNGLSWCSSSPLRIRLHNMLLTLIEVSFPLAVLFTKSLRDFLTRGIRGGKSQKIFNSLRAVFGKKSTGTNGKILRMNGKDLGIVNGVLEASKHQQGKLSSAPREDILKKLSMMSQDNSQECGDYRNIRMSPKSNEIKQF
ncbi:unnamed protein product [Citrullus colocynthis]|uniref:Uncharacterized protein n=1 Tax=Citrullus colocynthis TaxID=252529 RepID=A0ABP0YB39_9ROSI